MEPINNKTLKNLKKETDEENRINIVNKCINNIYVKLIEFAKIDDRTVFNYNINGNIPRPRSVLPNVQKENIKYEPKKQKPEDYEPKLCYATPEDAYYIKNNINDVIDGLKKLFPECSIEYKALSRGTDGRMYDIKDIDQKMMPFINQQFNQECIVIDWS